MSQDQNIDALLAPIPGSTPGGEDLSYAPELDAIREARRSDDPLLAQGDWETEIKTANWGRVRSLCEDLLKNRSKDFQVACWYAEAVARLDGFAGLDRGLQVVLSLLTDYWEFAYPELDPDDLDERAGKIEWLNAQLPVVVRGIAMTAASSGGYNWLQWDESRAVANLGLKDPDAMARAIADGKLAGDLFDKAVAASGPAFYKALCARLQTVEETLARLEAASEKAFGRDAPNLKDLRDAIRACSELAQRLFKAVGGGAVDAPAGMPGASGTVVAGAMPAGATAMGSGDSAMLFPAALSALPLAVAGNPQQAREHAVRQLREVARYFRQYEPHSPVAPLVERAAKWAEMPFEQWLANVIKDESTLNQLHDLLDVRPAQ